MQYPLCFTSREEGRDDAVLVDPSTPLFLRLTLQAKISERHKTGRNPRKRVVITALNSVNTCPKFYQRLRSGSMKMSGEHQRQ
jgi:hypothetical protein